MRTRSKQSTPLIVPERSYFVPSPWGRWRVGFSELGLRTFRLPGKTEPKALPELKNQEGAAGRDVLKAFQKRLSGETIELPWDIYDLSGLPAFHQKIWKAMTQIPHGEVRSYGQVAAAVGSPNAFRAAGSACGANPIVLFIPCHRVVAANSLGGFGSGLDWKKRLLTLEGYTC